MFESSKIKEAIFSILILMLSVFCLSAQNGEIKISGSFSQTPLKSFISEMELKYPVKFFYEDKYADNIYVSGVFNEMPLEGMS